MRNVKFKDEPRIDVKSIEARKVQFDRQKPSKKLQRRFSKLQEDLSNADALGNIVVMKKIYSFVDLYMEESVYPFSVCRKGCGYCCKVPATVSVLEAAYLHRAIAKETKLEFVPRPVGEVRDELDYCPAFDKETATCRGYEARPLNCRVFATFDSWKNCVNDNVEHSIHTWESSNALEFVRDYLDKVHLHNGFDDIFDIRDWMR